MAKRSKAAKSNSKTSGGAEAAPLANPHGLRVQYERPSPTIEESWGLDEIAEPDDAGMSLEELGQTYAAMMQQGADPYQDLRDQPAEPAADDSAAALEPTAEIPPQVLEGSDDRSCAITPRSILEAILFVGHPANEPLSSALIASLMRGVRPGEIDDLVRDLNEQYASERSAYMIESVGAGYQLALQGEFSSLRDKFYGRVREARLTPAAIDVLAIVAYQQPVGADEIEKLRSKPSGALLAQLVRRDLLSIERPPEKKAKPKYRTTARFLDLFDLESLADLPRSHDADRNL